MNLVLIKYNAGNVQSVLNALDRLGVTATVTDDKDEILAADKVIFPGVGHAKTAMQSLQGNGLDGVIKALNQPVLGICVGMQLLCAHSEEEATNCLNIIPVTVRKFAAVDASLKVPQVGWNQLYNLQSPLFKGIEEKSFVYNVHSYYAEQSPYAVANCHYGVEYAAAIKKDNFYGVQFHTEKSATVGDAILKNFLELKITA